MRKFLYRASYCLTMIGIGSLCAYVYDIEPVTEEKHYQQECQAYNRSEHFDHESFPSFSEWQAQNDERDQRASDYISSLVQQVGKDFADAVDWTRDIDASQPMSAEQWKINYGD